MSSPYDLAVQMFATKSDLNAVRDELKTEFRGDIDKLRGEMTSTIERTGNKLQAEIKEIREATTKLESSMRNWFGALTASLLLAMAGLCVTIATRDRPIAVAAATPPPPPHADTLPTPPSPPTTAPSHKTPP
ncbi:hypothetical protein CDN99_06720 [Roseateles aquatilis]|uniref:DUF1640 domain-containing protein n=1 Tax=Roseateles aquatilis TaxID=431061 RepID=A0A246JHJ9_9BURK|nr:hypothetical protein [Roseateles aquatilis]OWQ92045.1 hypothetical protein CDN99_06720 [Roseateles aquatilis]